ncbi:N-acetyltransferase [Tessaracoccus sp. ZS01]|uniref:GNAT family N-acetyltransferase n=1 Tax=Tessaracoccus sp. ZS01 TaxID=1906324 RepID=UPI00096F7CA9|nr:N-acetyltransferase [Tessaracoccus sp. ZS01]OMG54150.1 hypothetical protein BJN44_10650 [Tessaracoccus sp. ZS01]
MAALLSSICVSPEVQGGGVGTKVLTAWTARAAQMGAGSAYLTTDAENNRAANGFYLRTGWKHAGQIVEGRGRVMNVYRHNLVLSPSAERGNCP